MKKSNNKEKLVDFSFSKGMFEKSGERRRFSRGYLFFTVLITACLAITSCNKEEPTADFFMQVSTITNESGSEKSQIKYDPYRRVVSYKTTYPKESIIAQYDYVSDNYIKITTTDTVFDNNGEVYFTRTIEDELHLEKGRAAICDGLLRQNGPNKDTFERKYRHEFIYTLDNHINVVRWTEWNKAGEGWEEDKPWSWENYYYWEDGNLVKIEDYFGHTRPYITYNIEYSIVTGVQNIIPMQIGRYQYYPLQVKGIFGSMSINLIKEIDETDTFNGHITRSYQYEVTDGRITKYSIADERGNIDQFSVVWTK